MYIYTHATCENVHFSYMFQCDVLFTDDYTCLALLHPCNVESHLWLKDSPSAYVDSYLSGCPCVAGTDGVYCHLLIEKILVK